jgi:hypothetical protein
MSRPSKIPAKIVPIFNAAYEQAVKESESQTREYVDELAGGYTVRMTDNLATGTARLRDGQEVLTIPNQRRAEYAKWLRTCADRLEGVES